MQHGDTPTPARLRDAHCLHCHDAVAAADEFAPEVVLLDIVPPGMTASISPAALRTMPALAGAFLVAMSGSGSDDDRATSKEAGFDEYLIKPVDLDLLRTWLGNRP